MTQAEVLARIRAIVQEAYAERRGLVASARLGGAELDALARRVEREALERVAALLPQTALSPELEGIREALAELHAALEELEARSGIREDSRRLAQDEAIWQAFERVVHLLGLEGAF